MSSIKDLLATSASTIKAPPQFPAGNYIVVITEYDMLPFSWKNAGVYGLAYVPKIRCLSCIEADDDDVPELQKEQQEALDAYGDWTNKEFSFSYVDKESNDRMAAVAGVNFPILETDENHEEAVGILEKHAWRFYTRNDDGTEVGFVPDALSLSFPEDTPLQEVLEGTVGQQFMVNFEYEPNQDPQRPPNLVINSVTCI